MIWIKPETVQSDYREPPYISQFRKLVEQKKGSRAAELIEQALLRYERRRRLKAAAEASRQ